MGQRLRECGAESRNLRSIVLVHISALARIYKRVGLKKAIRQRTLGRRGSQHQNGKTNHLQYLQGRHRQQQEGIRGQQW